EVAVFAGDLDAAGQAADRLGPGAGDRTRAEAGATGQDLHPSDLAQHRPRILAEQPRLESARGDERLHRVAQPARLTADLLLHEGPIRAELQRRQRHVGQVLLALDRLVVAVEYLDAVAGDRGGIALLQEDHAARGLQDRGDVGGDEVLAFAQADQQRAAHA